MPSYKRSKHTTARKRIMGRFRSMSEKRIASLLRLKGIKFRYEKTHIAYSLRTTSKISCESCGSRVGRIYKTYIPDFELSNGVYIEVKGRLLPADKRKLEAVKQLHPDLNLVLLFDNNNLLGGKNVKKLRYGDWADKVGIPWSVKNIPDSWLEYADQPFDKPMSELTKLEIPKNVCIFYIH